MFNRSFCRVIEITLNRFEKGERGFLLLELLSSLGLFCFFCCSYVYFINTSYKSLRNALLQVKKLELVINTMEIALNSATDNAADDSNMTTTQYDCSRYTMDPVLHTPGYTYQFQRKFKFTIVRSSWKNGAGKERSCALARGMIGDM